MKKAFSLSKLTILIVLDLLIKTPDLKAQDTFWGMTNYGGTSNAGVIFKTDGLGNNISTSYSFHKHDGANPEGGTPIQASNGKFYGMTYLGGVVNVGVIYEYDPLTGIYLDKLDFNVTNGSNPFGSLMQASNGMLYGMTSAGGAHYAGVIFQYDPATGIYTDIYDFVGNKGSAPWGSLIQASNGKLYGMAGGGLYGYGVLFEYDLSTATYLDKYDFNNTGGSNPSGSLMQANDGKIYGTAAGGANGNGVIFRYDPTSGIYADIYDFASSINSNSADGTLMQASNGKLYGTMNAGGPFNVGLLFEFDLLSATFTDKHDFVSSPGGSSPVHVKLAQTANGKLYGLTFSSGAHNNGVIFEYDITSGIYTDRYDFDGASNGGMPEGGLLLASNGTLYGMTYSGGIANGGVLFSFNPSTYVYTKKIDLDFAPKGSGPQGSLVHAVDGKLYGMTNKGGVNNVGVIFKYDPVALSYSDVYDFNNINGTSPSGSLMQAGNGKLYGMTYSGGANNYGVIFVYNPITLTYTDLHDFDNTHGANPYGSLIQASNGKLYGMTYRGGVNGYGVIFEYDTTTSTYTDKYDFDNTHGANPFGALIQAGNGKLYGMTYNGGANSNGVLFEYDPIAATYLDKYDFVNTTGKNSSGSLIQASNGELYGMTNNGGINGNGVLFQYDIASGTYTDKYDFNGTNGATPEGSLMQGNNGNLYGMTYSGGTFSSGVIFEYNIGTNTQSLKQSFTVANGSYPAYGNLLEVCIPAVQPAPFTTSSNTVCPGQNGVVYTVPNDPTLTYTWSYSGIGATITGTGNNIQVNFSPAATTGTLSVNGNNGCSVSTSRTLVINVNTAPTPSITAGGTTTFCQGGSVLLTASGGTNYIWSVGATGSTITPNASNTYIVTVTNASGCASTASKIVTVNPLPTASITPGGPTAFCVGSVTLTASGGSNYLWNTAATTAAITVSASNTYIVTVSNAGGCSTIVNQVVYAGTPTAVITAGGTTTFCQGGSVNLTASGGGNFKWSTGATTAIITANSSNTYTVTVSNGVACSNATGQIVTVNPLPTASITATSTTTFCQGNSVTLTASGGINYIWSIGATTAAITANSSNTYIVTVTNASNCSGTTSQIVIVNALPTASITATSTTTFCQGNSVTLTASGGINYIWSTGATTAVITANSSNTYTVTVFNANACTATTSQVIVVNPLPTASITASSTTTFCQGNNVILTASGGISYMWSTGATTPAITVNSSNTYTVTVFNANACTAVASQVVTVNSLPIATITLNGAAAFCSGGSVTLTAGGGTNYTWSTGATATASITVNSSNTYTVTVSNASACTAVTSQVITVNPLPTATITANGATAFCQGNRVTLTAGGGAHYSWSTGTTVNAIISSSSSTYTVTVTDINGCTDFTTQVVTVNPLPTASITPNGPTTFFQGGSVTLTASGGTNYIWNTAATTPAINANTSNTYTVTVSNASGCTGTASQVVKVNPLPTPTFTVTGILSPFVSKVGTASSEQTIQVAGSGLRSNVTVTVPAPFEISLSSGTGFATALTLTVTAGNLATTTIYVHYNPTALGLNNGALAFNSTGMSAAAINIIGSTPVTAVSTTSLLPFNTIVGTPSTNQSFKVTGSYLCTNIAVTAPTHFQISLSPSNSFSNSINIVPINGTVDNIIVYVRYNPSTAGNHTGNISVTAAASIATETVAVVGNSVGTPSINVNGQFNIFTASPNKPSNPQVIFISFNNIQSPIIILASAPFEASLSYSGGYTNNLAFTPQNGTVSTTLYVRYNPTAIGTDNGVLSITSTAATPQSLSLQGICTVAQPGVSITGNTTPFSTFVDTPSVAQKIIVAGTDLTDKITINAPAQFEISLSSTTGYMNNINIDPNGGKVDATNIFVRFRPSTLGFHSGSISVTSTGADTKTTVVTGNADTVKKGINGIYTINKGADNLKVYPNPVTNGILNIESSKTIVAIDIYNSIGALMLHATTVVNSIDVSTLSKGEYTLIVKYQEGTATQKVVIQ